MLHVAASAYSKIFTLFTQRLPGNKDAAAEHGDGRNQPEHPRAVHPFHAEQPRLDCQVRISRFQCWRLVVSPISLYLKQF